MGCNFSEDTDNCASLCKAVTIMKISFHRSVSIVLKTLLFLISHYISETPPSFLGMGCNFSEDTDKLTYDMVRYLVKTL